MERDVKNRFVKGVSGNPAGKPKGTVSGRARALLLLDRVVGDAENLRVMKNALSAELRKRPVWFFINVIMPLLPKESRGVLEAGDRIVEWRGLVGVGRISEGADGERVVTVEGEREE